MRNVRSETLIDLDPRHLVDGVDDRAAMCSASPASTVTSRIFASALDADEVDRAEQAAGLADRLGEPRERAGLGSPGGREGWS